MLFSCCWYLGIILNYEKTLIIIQNSRHILFDTRRETKVTLNKLVTATYGENPSVVASSNANFASTNCVKNVIAAACVAFSYYYIERDSASVHWAKFDIKCVFHRIGQHKICARCQDSCCMLPLSICWGSI